MCPVVSRAIRSRQLVRLTAGARQEHPLQAGMKCRQQSFGVIDDRLIQVARMAVQHAGLAAQRFDDARMAMANVRDIVIGVQVSLAVGIIDPYSLATNELQRLLVEERGVAPQTLKRRSRRDCALISLSCSRRPAQPGFPEASSRHRRRSSGR